MHKSVHSILTAHKWSSTIVSAHVVVGASARVVIVVAEVACGAQVVNAQVVFGAQVVVGASGR